MLKVGPGARFVKLQEEADKLIFEQIHERRASDEDRDDILSMLLEARHEDGSPMSDQELRDELMTLLVAGHETTASTLAWAFSQLPHHPAVLDRLTDEVRNGDEGEYLDATINETLRHRPVLPNVQPRLVKKPIQIGDWEAPPGVCLVANAYLMHHDADIYDDPYAFRPERFVEEGAGHLHLHPVRRRPPPLPRRELRHGRDAAGAARRAVAVRPARRLGRRSGAGAAAQHHRSARRGRPGRPPRAKAGARSGMTDPAQLVTDTVRGMRRLGWLASALGAVVVFMSVGFLIPVFLDPSERS